MEFPQQFPYLVIPTGAGPGQRRITINFNQDGEIKVYNSTGDLVNVIGGDDGSITTQDSDGSSVVLTSGLGARILFTPQTVATNTWFNGIVGTTIGGGNHPALQFISPNEITTGFSSTITMQGSAKASTLTQIFYAADRHAFTGDVIVTGDVSANNLQSDTVPISFVAQASFTQAVTFPVAYAAGVVPVVITNLDSGAAVTIRWGFRAISITNTGFTIFVYKGDAADPNQTWTNINVQWFAHTP